MKSGKGGKIALVIAIVVIAVLVGVVGYLLGTRGNSDSQPQQEASDNKRNVVVTEDNVEEILDKLEADDQKVTPGYYTVTMPTTWHFASGTEASYDAVVENSVANTNDVYFDIVLEEDESRFLYKSPVIPIGAKLENITLEEVLPAGTYNSVVIYSLVDENQVVLSTVRVALTIVIET